MDDFLKNSEAIVDVTTLEVWHTLALVDKL